MKKILLFAAFAAMTAAAHAQTDKRDMRQNMDPKARAEMQTRHMQKKLNLTDDQARRIMDVNMQTMPAKDMTDDKQAMKGQRMDMMRKREEMYSQILTPAQMESFRKMKDERMDQMRERRMDRKNGKMSPAPADQP